MKKKVWSRFGILKHYPYICSTNKKPTHRQHGTDSTLFKTRRDKGRRDKNEVEEDNFNGGN